MSTEIDLSEFHQYSSPRGKDPCKIGLAASQINEAERELLWAAFADTSGRTRNNGIIEWLNKRGHDVSVSAITSHRKRRCSCGTN